MTEIPLSRGGEGVGETMSKSFTFGVEGRTSKLSEPPELPKWTSGVTDLDLDVVGGPFALISKGFCVRLKFTFLGVGIDILDSNSGLSRRRTPRKPTELGTNCVFFPESDYINGRRPPTPPSSSSCSPADATAPTITIVLYTGTIDFEPFRPINASLYLCDNKFHTEALNELLESDDKFRFIVMDGNGTLFGTLSGILAKYFTNLCLAELVCVLCFFLRHPGSSPCYYDFDMLVKMRTIIEIENGGTNLDG
ncbi:hypothetical protein LXL04_004486 [Taraxacum kok-saghyz]